MTALGEAADPRAIPAHHLGPQHIICVQACKSSGLQTFAVGSKSQAIGAKKQGTKRACGCPLVYIRFASASSRWQSSCKTISREFSAPICVGNGKAQRYVGREGVYETHIRAHRVPPSPTPMASGERCARKRTRLSSAGLATTCWRRSPISTNSWPMKQRRLIMGLKSY